MRSRPPIAVSILLCAAAAGALLHGAFTIADLGKPGLNGFFNDWVYQGVFSLAAAACLLRGILVSRERAAWLMVASGLCIWLAGDLYWNFRLSKFDEIPYPSFADVLYVGGYLPMYAGIAMLTRSRLQRVDRTAWLEGLIGALAVACVTLAFVHPAFAGSTEGNLTTVVVNLAYPLGDVVLLSLVVGAIALGGWRAEAGWAALALGLAVTGVADVIYLKQEATTGYTSGSWPDTMWLVGALAIAAAAWVPAGRRSAVALVTRRQFLVPAACACVAVGVQMYDHFERVSDPAIWLSGATLVAVTVRMAMFFERYSSLLRHSQSEALTDPLTGLGNRRALLDDLALAVKQEQVRFLALFDLDGFKSYNDAFGHPAGDALLVRLGGKLAAAVESHGRAYRLGGDEFCVLAALDHTTIDDLLSPAARALSDDGEAFTITSSHGAALLPAEAGEAHEALRLVDRRMYAQKGTRVGSAQRQTATVLLRTLHEREPELGSHIESVSDLASTVARCIGLDGEDIDLIARGAQLHDIGKMAVPDTILRKPEPLDDREWQVMREHTLTGERIVSSAPSLLPVAKLVRSSHERWDGGGYPDGLMAEEIPLGARIIALCDAFEAMIEDRPWARQRTPAEALEELQRCAGTQFDPQLVAVFAERVFPWMSDRGGPALPQHAAAVFA